MKQPFLRSIIAITFLIGSGANTLKLDAQDNEAPIVFWVPTVRLNDYYSVGDLWSINLSTNELQKIASWVDDGTTRLSPDGTQLVFTVYDQLGIDEINQHPPQDYDWPIIPSDIALLDLKSARITILANQPQDASFKIHYPEVKSSNYITRSAPVWSPDGAEIAWTEALIHYPSGLPTNPSNEPKQLVIYDLGEEKSKVIVQNFNPQLDNVTLDIQWGKSGIAVRTNDFDPDANGSGAFAGRFLVFDTSGTQLSAVNIGDIGDFIWVSDGLCDYIATLTDRPFGIGLGYFAWMVINPTSGKMYFMNGVPELYSTMAPLGLSVYPVVSNSDTIWQANISGKNSVDLGELITSSLSDLPLAISPNGQKIAYVNKQGQVIVYTREQSTVIKVSMPIEGLLWGPVAWRIQHNSTQQNPIECDR